MLIAGCGKMKSKRAQLKIQQMAFMLVAITIFFILAGMFALVLKHSSRQQEAESMQEKNAMLLASKIANSPEFSCGKAFGGDKIDCVDADKAMMLMKSSEKYKDFWEIENIELVKISSNSSELCGLGNYPNCGRIKIFNKETEGVGISNFVSLCRKESFEGGAYDKCDVARMVISYGLK